MALQLLDPALNLWQLTGETNGYLIVRGEKSLLIDCPAADLHLALRAAGLPAPEVVLHTQVQEEHCREWAAFPHARVFVSAASAEVARCSPAFVAGCHTVWPPTRDWGDTRGQEEYGIGGSTTERPPAHPLAVAGVLLPGEWFTWEDVTLAVVALPGSGRRALGFAWETAGLFFSGDLLVDGGYLTNLYDLERGYGILHGYRELRASLARALAYQPARLLPTTGPVIDDPPAASTALTARLDQLLAPPRHAGAAESFMNYPPLRTFGRYHEVAPGIAQCNTGGNIILYVDAQGRGLMIDPDPCVWLSWEENCREMHADLDLLEREMGLQYIELALITHAHGDHVQYCDLLRARYGTVIAATPDVAELLEYPERYPYPCLVDWYGFPFTRVEVDRRLAYEETFFWHDTPVTPFWSPGHAGAHAGYAIPWRGELTACTGDTLQYGDGPMAHNLPITYNDNPWPEHAAAVTLRRLLALQPALILGGHSHTFRDPDSEILRELLEVEEEAMALATALIADGNLSRATTPPGYAEIRPAQV